MIQVNPLELRSKTGCSQLRRRFGGRGGVRERTSELVQVVHERVIFAQRTLDRTDRGTGERVVAVEVCPAGGDSCREGRFKTGNDAFVAGHTGHSAGNRRGAQGGVPLFFDEEGFDGGVFESSLDFIDEGFFIGVGYVGHKFIKLV